MPLMIQFRINMCFLRPQKLIHLTLSCSFFIGLILPLSTLELYREARATTVLPLSLGQLTRQSHLVILGQVQSREVTETATGSFWTHYQIKIEEQWHGEPVQKNQVIHLSLQGGQLGEGMTARGQIIHGQPELQVDQRGVFFLERTAAGQLVFTGLSQGWFAIEKHDDGIEWVTRDDVQAHLHRPVKVQPLSTAPSSLNELPLSTLRQLVIHGPIKPLPFRSRGLHERGEALRLVKGGVQ